MGFLRCSPAQGRGGRPEGAPLLGFSLLASHFVLLSLQKLPSGEGMAVSELASLAWGGLMSLGLYHPSGISKYFTRPLVQRARGLPCPGPTHTHPSPLKPSVYCAEPSPCFPDAALVAMLPATLPRSRPDIPGWQGWGGSREAVRAGCLARRTLWSQN